MTALILTVLLAVMAGPGALAASGAYLGQDAPSGSSSLVPDDTYGHRIGIATEDEDEDESSPGGDFFNPRDDYDSSSQADFFNSRDDYDSSSDGDFFTPYDDGGRSRGAMVGSSAINCGNNRDVVHNVTLAAECINDTMLDSGDAFSFNDVVGPRTSRYGYRQATNGRGVKVTGGGVAQVASALWLAIKDCYDIEILEKSTYGSRYNQHYVYSSEDAILTDYASGRDFRFRYTGDYRLTIYTYMDNGWLCCEIYED